jgi:hypothetical protein
MPYVCPVTEEVSMNRLKRMFLATLTGLALCLLFVPANAQFPGTVIVSSDAAGTDCSIVDTGGLVQVHIVHMHTDGVRGSRFMLDPAPGWTHLGDMPDFPSLGTSISGMIVCMPSCMSSDIHLTTVNFFGSAAPPCTYISIVPDPAAPSGSIEALDCNWNPMYPTGGQAIVNPEGGCFCHAAVAPGGENRAPNERGIDNPSKLPAAHFCSPVPVQQSTWGAIKSLYEY